MVETTTIDELVDDIDGAFFPVAFIDRHPYDPEKAVVAFDAAKARDYVQRYGYMGDDERHIPRRLIDRLPDRLLFEELVRATANRGLDFLDEGGIRVRITGE